MKTKISINEEAVKELDKDLTTQINELVDNQINVKFDNMISDLVAALVLVVIVCVFAYLIDDIIQHWWNGKMANECFRGCMAANEYNKNFSFQCSTFCWSGRMP